MTPYLQTRPRPYADALRDVIASREIMLSLTTHPHQKLALSEEIYRLQQILAEEEAL